MKNRKKLSRFQKSTAVLLVAAVGLLAGSAIGSTRAALTYFSENYAAQMNTQEISVQLKENGEVIADNGVESGELLKDLDGEKIQLGKKYTEELAVKNTGDIPQYVRVRIYKSWSDDSGKKDTTLSPSYISLNMNPQNGWIEDVNAATTERSVWYYTEPLNVNEETSLLCDTIMIDNDVASRVDIDTRSENGQQITTYTYAYDDYSFSITAEVDAVQNHNAQDAIKSAWGVDVKMSGDTITDVSTR